MAKSMELLICFSSIEKVVLKKIENWHGIVLLKDP